MVENSLVIPSASVFRPTIINKSQLIKSIGSRLRDHTRTFDSSVHAQCASRRTLPAEGIPLRRIKPSMYIGNISYVRRRQESQALM